MNIKSKNGKSLVIIVIALLLVVAVLAGVAVMKMSGGKKKDDKEAKKEEHAEKLHGTPLPMGEFVVNLADTDELRYLKVDLVLEVFGEGAEGGGGGHGEKAGPDPKIRDAIITVLSSKTFKELTQPKGKEELKAEIMKMVNERLPVGQKALDVYFNEFAMQ